MKISDYLEVNSSPLITIGPEETVLAAIRKLVEHGIGAMPVCDGKGRLLGIISERDLLQEVSLRSGDIDKTKVQGVMTRDVAIATPDDGLNYAASVMRQLRIRHLPVVAGQKLKGIVSMRDIVDRELAEFKAEIHYLRSW
ncbi:MAG: CBS domain-containing protein [Chloroflexota bacterium]